MEDDKSPEGAQYSDETIALAASISWENLCLRSWDHFMNQIKARELGRFMGGELTDDSVIEARKAIGIIIDFWMMVDAKTAYMLKEKH